MRWEDDLTARQGGAVAGGVEAGARATAVHDARVLRDVLRAIRPHRSVRLAEDAARVLKDVGPSGRDGAFGQVSGKVHEVLATSRANWRPSSWVRFERTVMQPNPQSPVVDAEVVRWWGTCVRKISYKKSASGAWRSAGSTPGDVVIAVPTDQFVEAGTRVGTTGIVVDSGVTTTAIDETSRRGLGNLAANGEAAASMLRAAGRAGFVGAASMVVVGGLVDYARGIRSGEMSWSRFAAERGGDAVEGATAGLAGWSAASVAAVAIAGGAMSVGTVAPIVVPIAAGVTAGVATGMVTRRVRAAITKVLTRSDHADGEQAEVLPIAREPIDTPSTRYPRTLIELAG